MKAKRGGAREGAGRPKEGVVKVCLTVAPETRERLKELAKTLGVGAGKIIDRIVKDLK